MVKAKTKPTALLTAVVIENFIPITPDDHLVQEKVLAATQLEPVAVENTNSLHSLKINLTWVNKKHDTRTGIKKNRQLVKCDKGEKKNSQKTARYRLPALSSGVDCTGVHSLGGTAGQ